MLKTITKTNGTVAANATIPFELVFNTNDSTGYSGPGVGTIRKPGFYELDANITVTDVASGDITVSFYSNGTELTEVSATATSAATTDFLTIPLTDTVRAIWSQLDAPATISVRLSAAATVVAGSIFTIKKIK